MSVAVPKGKFLHYLLSTYSQHLQTNQALMQCREKQKLVSEQIIAGFPMNLSHYMNLQDFDISGPWNHVTFPGEKNFIEFFRNMKLFFFHKRFAITLCSGLYLIIRAHQKTLPKLYVNNRNSLQTFGVEQSTDSRTDVQHIQVLLCLSNTVTLPMCVTAVYNEPGCTKLNSIPEQRSLHKYFRKFYLVG